MTQPILILPGIGNSGPLHWQSVWENNNPDFRRVRQNDWDNPVRHNWVAALEAAVRESGPQTIPVAHSLGCLTLAHWAATVHAPVRAAMLVAVPDPESPAFPKTAVGFDNIPLKPLGFNSLVVVSSDDVFGSVAHAQKCAAAWESRLVNIGTKGHINAQSNLGSWQEGVALLQTLFDA